MKRKLLAGFALCTALAVPFVFAQPSQAATVKLNKTTVSIYKGKTYKLKVSGTKTKVKWTTSNKKVATVTSAGTVKGIKKGTAYISAKVGTKTLKCKVTVKEFPKLNKTSVSIYKGKTYKLSIANTNSKVTWSSNNKSVATVTSAGTVKGVKKGSAYITAKVDGQTLKCKVTVKELPKLNKTSISVYKGETYQLNVANTNSKATWSSSNTSVASVTSTGTVKGLSKGSAYIYAKVDGQTLKCKVTIAYKEGSRELPFSAYNETGIQLNDEAYVKLQLLECIDGEEANKIIMYEANVDEPEAGKRWVLYHFNLKYISGFYSKFANSVIDETSFFDQNSLKKLNFQLPYFYHELNGKGVNSIEIYPGGEDDFYIAALLDDAIEYTTFRVVTFTNGYEEVWFTTKK